MKLGLDSYSTRNSGLDPLGVLGLVEEPRYHSLQTTLSPGDVLVLYSDCYTEALDSASQEFGADRLADLCATVAAEPLDTVARSLERELDTFCAGSPPSDDSTLVMVRRRGGASD